MPSAIEPFLETARLRIGDSQDFVENGHLRVVDPTELEAGEFVLELAADDGSFAQALDAAVAAGNEYGERALEFVVVASSAYLKLTEMVVREPLDQVNRTVLLNGTNTRAFKAIHHGCDVAAYVVLRDQLHHHPLRPWRKGTWLSRATFALRTQLDGLGFTILPLTETKRAELHLPAKTLRYTLLDESPLETSSIATVTLYVDADLLALLNKTPRKSWARAFTDQLAVDVLTAVAVRALADPGLSTTSWESVEGKLLGALLMMVGGKPSSDGASEHYDALLDILRTDPLKFLARIEGALEMRDSARLISGGS